MKSFLQLALAAIALIIVVWFILSREADQWRICRSLDHGVVYCIFAQGGIK